MGKGGRRVYLLVLAAVILGACLHWPSLGSGLAADDYQQRMMLDDEYPVRRSPLDLYAFVHGPGDRAPLVDRGLLPWWTHPDLRLSGFRPLSSALIVLDHRVIGSAWGAHLHSLFWWALLVLSVAALFFATLPRSIAALATLAFAVDPAHVIPVAWLANRPTLLSVAFGALALWGYVRWREREWAKGAILAAVATSLALAAGEYGVGVLGYAVAYELVGARQREGGWVAAVGGMAPVAAPTAVYLVAHRSLGYGAVASSTYVDPLSETLQFSSHAVTRFPALLANELLTVPGELTHDALVLGYAGALLLLIPLALVLAMLPGLFRRLEPRARRMLGFLALGASFSLLPLLGAFPSVRLLVLPSVGGSALIAALIVDAWSTLKRRGGTLRERLGRGLRVAIGVVLGLAHLVAAPLATWAGAATWTALQRATRQSYLDARLGRGPAILVNAPEPGTLIYPPVVRHAHGLAAPARWRVLAMTTGPHTLRRVDNSTLELYAPRGALSHPLAELFRAAELPLHEGESVRTSSVQVKVVKVARGEPVQLRFRFDTPLDRQTVLVSGKNGLEPIRLPKAGSQRSWP